MQQFYMRTVLAVGVLWGAYLLVQLLVFALSHGSTASFLTKSAFVVNCLTVAPACTLAFWRRRAAFVWLVLDAILIAAAAVVYTLRTHLFGPDLVGGAAGSILLAVFLLVTENRRWPGALTRDAR